MFEEIVRIAGRIIHCAFIPVVHAASNESKAFSGENVFDRMKEAVTPK